MADFVTRYFCAKRGIIKVFQIILGFLICSIICSRWYGGRSCLGESRLGYASGLNFIALILNFVLYFCNMCNTAIWKLERYYSPLCTILFGIAIVLLVWFMIQHNDSLIVTIALFVLQTLLFLWDSIILRGDSYN